MAREWSFGLVGDDGMVIRRDNEVRRDYDKAGETVTVTYWVSPGTYAVVDPYGQVTDQIVMSGSGEIVLRYPSYPEIRSTDALVRNDGTILCEEFGFEPIPKVLLPDGNTDPESASWCNCNFCREIKGANMDREQVARIAADIGSSLMPDNSQWKNRFTVSSTSSSRVYTVAQRRSDDVWGCSCPSWINRRHCKHLVDILERLAKLTEFDVTDPAVLDMLRSARTTYLDLDNDSAFRVPSRFRTAPQTTRHIDL